MDESQNFSIFAGTADAKDLINPKNDLSKTKFSYIVTSSF